MGGVAELQKYDSDQFQFWAGSQCYDKNGEYLWSLDVDAPFLLTAVEDLTKRYNYIVTMAPRHYEDCYENSDEYVMIKSPRMRPVFVPVTMNRSGMFSYDLSSLEGIQLYFQTYGEQFIPTNTIGPITIQEAFDLNYFSVLEGHMKEFMETHDEVERISLWEMVLFKQRPHKPVTE